MSSYFLPPPLWFKTAKDIIGWAKLEKRVDDFVLDCKMRPQILGQSYSYRIDVMNELIRNELVALEDEKLVIGESIEVDWLTHALGEGSQLAWELVDAIGNSKAIAKKFNAEELKRIGDLGEKYVFSILEQTHTNELHSQLKHVSLKDDTLGYDIKGLSVQDAERPSYLEVKTTVKPVINTFEFYLSRNEFEVGRRNRNWCIVAIAIKNGEPEVIGHLYCYQFESRIPRDLHYDISWETYKLKLNLSLFRDGLP